MYEETKDRQKERLQNKNTLSVEQMHFVLYYTGMVPPAQQNLYTTVHTESLNSKALIWEMP